MKYYKWKVSPEEFPNIVSFLEEIGFSPRLITNQHEVWRGGKRGLGSAILYETGTLLLNCGEATAGRVENFLNKDLPISLLGCDEAGKGEPVGHLFAVCCVFRSRYYVRLRGAVSTATTKRKASLQKWRELAENVLETAETCWAVVVPPSTLDTHNINDVLTCAYNSMLALFCAQNEGSARAVVDDFGGKGLAFSCGELLVVTHSEEQYPEVNGAAVVAKFLKKTEESALRARLKGAGARFSSLSLNDRQLREFLTSHAELPFVRRSFLGLGSGKRRGKLSLPTPVELKNVKDCEELGEKAGMKEE